MRGALTNPFPQSLDNEHKVEWLDAFWPRLTAECKITRKAPAGSIIPVAGLIRPCAIYTCVSTDENLD